MVLLIGFGIGYCIYNHRYQEIIIFLVVGMIMMAGMFAVTVVEDICDTLLYCKLLENGRIKISGEATLVAISDIVVDY
jgi:hypothetical protein